MAVKIEERGKAAPPSPTPGRSEDSNRVPWSRKARPYLILAPALLLTIGILYPFILAIIYSFTNYSFKYAGSEFIGLRNWTTMFKNPDFWHSLSVTLRYAFWATGIETVLGFAVAMLLNRDNFLARILRTVLIFPLMIAPVIATLIWQLMTNSSVGIISHWLRNIGISNFTWGANPHTALFSVVLIDIWVNTPFMILLILAGLRSLPQAPFEAAMLDGGSPWFTFKTLTMPLIMPALLIAVIFRLMLSLQEYAIIFALTRGGPGDTLMSLTLTAYTEAFTYKELGAALPYMLVLWVIIYIISNYMIKYWGNAQKRASGI
ncbi:sugar ABC transporter permease [Moorella naiadis]|uniref:carbohydrate ABC transporter permease n=1 Tax=Moorella naiadis (nom. illeg.) TaxID=3093670 RepID=UPI003D9C94E1